MLSFLKIYYRNIYKSFYKKKSKKFFEDKKLLKYFINENSEEYKPNYAKLYNLYNFITLRKPRCILEFGTGFSTIAMSLALLENHKNGHDGKIFVVDAEEKWLENTKNKLPNELKNFVNFFPSKTFTKFLNGSLVSLFDKLPNICPDFILLDGPHPDSIIGDYNNLSFQSNSAVNYLNRPVISADILLYESTAPNKFFIYVDGRWRNSIFLKQHLKYIYKYKINHALKYSTLEKTNIF